MELQFIPLPFKEKPYTEDEIILFIGRHLKVDFATAKERITPKDHIKKDEFDRHDEIIGKYDGQITSFKAGNGEFPVAHGRYNFKPGMFVAITVEGVAARKPLKSKIDLGPHRPSRLYQRIRAEIAAGRAFG